jgi:hypothetical protein
MALGVLVLALPVRASEQLREGVAAMAKGIAPLFQDRPKEIAVGQFTGPARYPTSAGPAIAQMLAEELQKLGFTVKKVAPFGIKGEYQVTEVPGEEPAGRREAPGPKVLAIQLKGIVEDDLGKVLTDFTFKHTVKGEAAFVSLLGTPVSLPPEDSPEKRDTRLRESLREPKTFISGSRVSASADGRLAIEVLVNGQPRALKKEDRLAYLSDRIKRGETYAVRLINDTEQEMAVQLSIDGLSVFQFSELRHKEGPKMGQPLYSSVIVGPHKNVLIRGWHRTNERSDELLVTEYAKTAAASVLQPANIGTITATFRAAWPRDQAPPADEPSRPKGSTSGDGTGFGKSFDQKFKELQRTIGVIRSSVSVRYTK